MVVNADTVVDPRAVVIIAFDTATAYWTMLGAWSHEDFAVCAELAGVDFLQQFNEFVFWLQIAGIGEGGC